MIKDVKYTGYQATPSDYESADGELSTAINLIQEDGGLRPIREPSTVATMSHGYKLLLIHSTSSGEKNYILCDKETRCKLYWLTTSNGDGSTAAKKTVLGILLTDTAAADSETADSEATDSSTPTLIAELSTALTDIAAIGNTLSLSIVNGSSSHMEYILWNGKSYDYLGEQPKGIGISFALTDLPMNDKDTTKTSSITMDNDDYAKAALYGFSGDFEMSTTLQTAMSNAVWGHLLEFVAEQCTEKNRFYQPFFIRYAFRLYDGSYIKHSAPILMIPYNGIPPVIANWSISESKVWTLKSNFKYMPICKLMYKVMGTEAEQLKLWKDVITHVVIFMSAPIYKINESKNFPRKNSEKTAIGNMFTTGIQGFTHSAQGDDMSNSNVERTIQGDASQRGWAYPSYSEEEYREKLTSVATFYKVKEIEIEDIIAKVGGAFEELEMAESIQSSLTTREVLPDDYQTNHHYAGKSLYAFNNRLNMANITLGLFDGYMLDRMSQYTSKDSYSGCRTMITTSVKKSAKVYEVQVTNAGDGNPYIDYFPRYLFYPDAGASKMVIEFIVNEKSIKRMTIALKSHPTLNGAYYFRGMELDAETPQIEEAESPTSIDKTAVLLPNKLYTSEVDNPFDFLATGINTVGTGTIIGIRSAARALSQGQFGQFPLYAFTTEGIWALEVTSTGSYSSKQPITRDICINADSITQIDSSVLFATDRGIMEIAGSTSTCISDVIDNIYTILDDTTLPNIAAIAKHAAVDLEDITLTKFRSYIRECGLVYDYVNQRIIVYNPSYTYAYVYSLKSKAWSTMHSDIAYHLNSYPESLAVTRYVEGSEEDTVGIIDLSATDSSTAKFGLIITRPFKLDLPDVYKTIRRLMQRGVFRTGRVQQVLYGSNDLINWFTLASSSDETMRFLTGSPFKYFKLAVISNITAAESIDGFSADVTAKFTNRLR
jgi:hypothetical protein